MPAKSEKQRRFMGAELFRARAGKKTQTGMSESKLSEFASKSMDAINIYLKKEGVPIVANTPKLCPFPGCEKGYWNTRAHNLLEHGGRKPIGGWKGDEQLTREQFDALAKPNIAEREKAEGKLIKSKPKKNNVFVKSLDLIDTYLDLLKRGRMLPCGHQVEDGSALDKGCSVQGCDTQYATPQGYQGGVNVFGPGRTGIDSGPAVTWGGNTGPSASSGALGPGGPGGTGSKYGTSTLPTGSSGIHQTTNSSGSSGGYSGVPEGGFNRSADSINLINRYLDKQSRVKCGHKKGDPNHVEAA